MEYYTIVEDTYTQKYLHLDIRWRVSWVKDKKDATPLESNQFYFDWLDKKGFTTYTYMWHRCDKNGCFI